MRIWLFVMILLAGTFACEEKKTEPPKTAAEPAPTQSETLSRPTETTQIEVKAEAESFEKLKTADEEAEQEVEPPQDIIVKVPKGYRVVNAMAGFNHFWYLICKKNNSSKCMMISDDTDMKILFEEKR